MRDEAAGIIQGGVQEGLHLAAAWALDVGPEQHVGLPDLIAGLSFELLVRGRDQQLALSEAALFEEPVQRGGGHAGSVLARRQGQFAQQGGAGAMRVFALQAFDQVGELRGNGARLTAILPRFGGQGLEAIGAVAERPIQQRIDGNRNAFGIGDVVVTGGNLLSAAGEFSAGKRFQNQRRNYAVSKQGEFSALASMTGRYAGPVVGRDANVVCGRSSGWESRPERGTTAVRNQKARPA